MSPEKLLCQTCLVILVNKILIIRQNKAYQISPSKKQFCFNKTAWESGNSITYPERVYLRWVKKKVVKKLNVKNERKKKKEKRKKKKEKRKKKKEKRKKKKEKRKKKKVWLKAREDTTDDV